jgi:hypothetical protein
MMAKHRDGTTNEDQNRQAARREPIAARRTLQKDGKVLPHQAKHVKGQAKGSSGQQ